MNITKILSIAAVAALSTATAAFSQVPERVIVLSGDSANAHPQVMTVLYDSNDLQFLDAQAPRFLFLDRKGSIALGIGGQIYGTMSYDFGGISPTGADFIPFDIPAPGDPAQRDALQFTANHSTIFLQLAGHNSKIGTYSAYVQAGFTGGSSYDFRLKQCYFKIGPWTMGLALSTFADPAGLPTVNTQGTNGVVDTKNVLVSYTPRLGRHWRVGIGLEQPKATYTTGAHAQSINQRVPDVPLFAEYDWGSGSHVRLSGIFRDLSYRNLAVGQNKLVPGWGVQLSSAIDIISGLSFYGSASFGRGIGGFINDLKGNDVDLVPAAQPGRLIAPRTFAYVAGLRHDFSKRLFASAGWSQVRLYDGQHMAPEAFRMSTYVSANVFWTVFPECRLGAEYARGFRLNRDRTSGHANRIMLAAKYSF